MPGIRFSLSILSEKVHVYLSLYSLTLLAKSKFSIFASVVFLSDYLHHLYRSNPPEVFLGKGVLKICGKYTGEYPCLYWNRTSAWLFSCKFAAYFQSTFFKNTSGRLPLSLGGCSSDIAFSYFFRRYIIGQWEQASSK